MGIRYRKYFSQCKPITCNGRPNKRYCPNDRPKRSNGEYKTCGTWCIEFFDDRKEWQSLTFKDVTCKTEAEKRLVLFISDRERGKLNLPKRKIVPTLAEYGKTYLELHKHAKEATYLLKLRMVTTLTRYLGDYPLDKITSFIIEKYRVERKEKDGVKDSSINVDIAVLGHIFNTAIKSGIVDKNPCQNVKRLKVTQSKDRILSNDEMALLLDKLQGKDRLMILVGLFTGLRLGGVLCLSWHDIDFGKGLITSSHKTGKLVSIPMSGYLSGELLRYKEINPGNDRIFETREITPEISCRYSEHFSDLFKSLGIQGFTFHNLRHTFASLLQAELGVGAVVVQGMTGHSSLGMLQKYSHTGLSNKQHAIQALTDHVLGMNSKPSLAIAQ